MANKYGIEQLKIWRRSYDVPPPAMEKDHPFYETIMRDQISKDGPTRDELPLTESLKDVTERVIPYWNRQIAPQIRENKNVFIASHGSTNRAILKYLENISDDDIKTLNIPVAIPFEIYLDDDMKPLRKMQYLGDQKAAQEAAKKVAEQIIEDPKRS